MISKKQDPKQKDKLSVGQVEHIAKLARIELTEKEKEKFTKELSAILDYVEKLNQVDTKNVDRIAQITGLEGIVRDDESRIMNYESRKKILKNVPNKKSDYFKVPKILE